MTSSTKKPAKSHAQGPATRPRTATSAAVAADLLRGRLRRTGSGSVQDPFAGSPVFDVDRAGTAPSSEGKKFDTGKLRFTLFPVEALNPILEVLEHGAQKYGEHNWRLVDNAKDRYMNALHRHVIDYLSGVRLDKDSGLPVMAHIACNAVFLLAIDVKERMP